MNGPAVDCIHHSMTRNKSWLIKNCCSKRFQVNMKSTVFVVLLCFVALTKAISYKVDCDNSCDGSCPGCISEEKMVCASNGKTYPNKWV